MQMRLLLLAVSVLSVALAGCAQNNEVPTPTTATSGGAPTPASPTGASPETPTTPTGGTDGGSSGSLSNAEAQALFAQASENVPERYGLRMTATRGTTELMRADALFDNTTQTAYFRMSFDESVLEDMGGDDGGMMPVDPAAFANFAMYTTPEGSAILMNDTVMLTPPDDGTVDQTAGESEGFGALLEPEEFLGALDEEGFEVQSVTPTTHRGKAAVRIEATVDDPEDGLQNVTIFVFRDPARVARIEGEVVATSEDEEDPFANSTMAMDFLYDDEVALSVPTDLVRALGLRYESNRDPFSFGGDDEGPEVWTFQADGGIALDEIEVQVALEMGADVPDWTMALTEGSMSQDGVTLTFEDVDADGALSAGDTLTIERTDEAMMAQVALKDLVTGLRVVPGAGLALALLALAAVALAARRR